MTRWRRTTACERAAQWISLELDGELGRLEQAALARHLRRCGRCRSTSSDIGMFTSALRDSPPVEPSRAVDVVTPEWARRRARRKVRGGILALAVTVSGAFAVAAIPHSGGESPSTIGFSGAEQQQQFARDHARSEPTLFVVAENAPPPSLASRPLL
jgi:predicted anti-sigma-YlaC factor YlaD